MSIYKHTDNYGETLTVDSREENVIDFHFEPAESGQQVNYVSFSKEDLKHLIDYLNTIK